VHDQVAIELVTPTGIIDGTLTLPAEAHPPVALLVAGSGPTDRNGNSTLLPGPNDSYLMLALGLAERGIASVRYDKRGVGLSKAAMRSEAELRFDDYVSDAEAWVRKLLQDGRFPGVGIIGHSEGSLVGMLAAARTKTGAYASIAGAGEPASQLIRGQLSSIPENLRGEAGRILKVLEHGQAVSDVPESLNALFRPSVQPYLLSWFQYDPAAVLAGLGQPVLVAQGTADLQVGVDQAQMLHRAKPDAELRIIEGMNHVLKFVGEDLAKNQRSYSDPSLPVDGRLVKAVGDFLLRYLK
jgi:pimeloyl-ACP methyl ester carboxylesterase